MYIHISSLAAGFMAMCFSRRNTTGRQFDFPKLLHKGCWDGRTSGLHLHRFFQCFAGMAKSFPTMLAAAVALLLAVTVTSLPVNISPTNTPKPECTACKQLIGAMQVGSVFHPSMSRP